MKPITTPLTAKQAGMVEHINPDNQHRKTQVWCGREGWLKLGEVVHRTEEDIAQYFKEQPLRARQALSGYNRFHWGDYIHGASRLSVLYHTKKQKGEI